MARPPREESHARDSGWWEVCDSASTSSPGGVQRGPHASGSGWRGARCQTPDDSASSTERNRFGDVELAVRATTQMILHAVANVYTMVEQLKHSCIDVISSLPVL